MANYPKIDVKNKVLLQGVHYLTSDYKSRNKSRPTHTGIDMIGKGYACDYIVAIADGKITEVAFDTSRGNWVKILHNSGLSSVYYHMKTNSVCVKKGASIKKGDKIGYMGTTGHSTGNHLHFGVYDGNKDIDPLPYLNGTKDIDGGIVPPTPPAPTKEYVIINAKSGVWCRKGIGFKYPKYKAIPYGTKCELLQKNAGKSDGYNWDKIIYNKVEVYLPNKWNKYTK